MLSSREVHNLPRMKRSSNVCVLTLGPALFLPHPQTFQFLPILSVYTMVRDTTITSPSGWGIMIKRPASIFPSHIEFWGDDIRGLISSPKGSLVGFNQSYGPTSIISQHHFPILWSHFHQDSRRSQCPWHSPGEEGCFRNGHVTI